MSRITVTKACDACRRRKVRCNWDQPCSACKQADLQCTFLSVRQKKGRKGDTANVISELRNVQSEPIRYAAPSSPEPGQNLHYAHYTSPSLSIDAQTSPRGLDSQLNRTNFLRSTGLLPQRIVDLCTELYFSQMRSTVPILTHSFVKQATLSAAAGGAGRRVLLPLMLILRLCHSPDWWHHIGATSSGRYPLRADPFWTTAFARSAGGPKSPGHPGNTDIAHSRAHILHLRVPFGIGETSTGMVLFTRGNNTVYFCNTGLKRWVDR